MKSTRKASAEVVRTALAWGCGAAIGAGSPAIVGGCQQEHHKTVTRTVDEIPTEKTKTVEKYETKTETQQK
jgi:hypothetical protein